MFKIIFALLLSLISITIQAQSISKRTVDSSGSIMIFTTPDTLALGSNYCVVEGVIFNADSVNYYAVILYFNAPQTFFLIAKDKIRIRYNDGEVYDEFAYTEGEFFTEGQLLKVMLPVSEKALNKIVRNPVTSITLITEKFKHTLKVDDAYNKSFQNLSQYMLHMNVYDENGIKWSELTEMKFPEN